MATIDDKVVAMSFESSKFESGVNKTISSLDKLKAKLSFQGAGKGLNDLSTASKSVSFNPIGASADKAKHSIDVMHVAALVAIGTIARQATLAGEQILKSFTLDPIVAGFHNYETQINAVQTILANTGLKGKKGLGQVNDALAQLNTYANKTVYNFSEMARNIGTFTAAGVDLKTSTASIKGIANLAALSGSTSEQASTAMYQLSQAIAAGQVHLQDWNSVVNAGMGGKVFQKALANTAQAMGTLKEGSVKLVGPMKQLTINGNSFRQALQTKPGQKSWLTSDVLTTTLKQFTGDMTKGQLAAIGFSNAQIKAIQAQGAMALHAATNIKTFTQLQQALKEEVATAWGAIFKTIFGNLGQATTLFSKVHTVAENALTIPIYNLNKLLEGWAKLGGRQAVINGLGNAFKALGAIMAPIKAAFRDIFPPTTAKSLADASKRFEEFTKKLKPSHETVDNLRRTFRGLFAVLDIGKQIVGGIFHVFGMLLGVVGKGSGGFLSFTARIGDFLVAVDKALKQGNKLHNFFSLLGQVILVPVHALGVLKDAITKSTQGLHPVQSILNGISTAWSKLTGQVRGGGNLLQPVVKNLSNVFGTLGTSITNALTNINFNNIATVVAVGLFGAFTVAFKKFAKGGFDNAILSGLFKNISGSFGGLTFALKGLGGAFGGVSKVLNGLTGNLEAMQQKTKAQALKELAIAIALIAASAVALSLVNPQKLNAAMGSLTIMFGQLLGAMAVLNKIGNSGGFLKLPVIAGSMILLAGAVDLLTLAVLGLSRLNWDQLAKGLVGIAGLLGAISVAAGPLGRNSAGLVRAGVGISAIGVALNILALAVRQFGSMDISTLGKGLGAVALALAGIGTASRLFPTGMIQIGVSLTIIAGALLLLSKSVHTFGTMQWGVIGKGLVGVAGAIAAIGVAMRLMPRGIIAQALALGIVALAIGKIAAVVKEFGGMSIDGIAKGVGTLAASLAILAIALAAMDGSLPGAAALIVAAGAIAILAPALKAIGSMSVGDLIKSMIGLAAALTILGVAGALLTPVTPSLLALGAAMVLIGGGFALVGAGVALVGVGLSAIAVSGPIAVGILIKAMESFLGAVPKIASGFVNAVLSIVQNIAKTAPQFVSAIVKIITALVSAIPPLAPKLGAAFLALLQVALHVISKAFPQLVQAGYQMILALLRGISQHIVQVTNQAVQIVTRFLGAIANNIPKIMAAGLNVLLAIVKGIANNVSRVITVGASIVAHFITGIANNMGKIVTAGASAISHFLDAVGKAGGKIISAGGNMVAHIVTGIGNAASRIVTAGTTAAAKFVGAVSRGMVKLVNMAGKAILNFMLAIDAAVNKYMPQITAIAIQIGEDMVTGVIKGLGNKVVNLADGVKNLAGGALHSFKHFIGSLSPSKKFMEEGHNIVSGLTIGISHHASAVAASASMANNVVGAFASSVVKLSPGLIRILNGVGGDAGHEFNAGLLLGLTDQKNPIDQAFQNTSDSIMKQVSDTNKRIQASDKALVNAQKSIAADEKKINDAKAKDRAKVRKSVQGDIDANSKLIDSQKKALAQNRNLLKTLTDTNSLVINGLDSEKTKLKGLYDQYNTLVKQLQDANTALDTIKQTQSDFATNTADSLGTLPDIVSTDANGNPIDPTTQVNNYVDSLGTAGTALSDFTDTINQLRNMGLDDATYKKLLNIGPAAEDFAKALLNLGPDAVSKINAADSTISSEATTLGDNASHSLYDAGVKAAQGLVDGLNDQINNPDPNKGIIAAIRQLADQIVKTIKKKLKIKSPSEVMAEIGVFMSQGMAKGLRSSAGHVEDAMTHVANTAISAMHDALGGIDANPTITPILDLTHIKSGAEEVGSIFAGLNPAISSVHASAINSQDSVAPNAATESTIKFEQNNYSPESLSSVEIYRQTKNQLSQARPVLAT